MVQPIERIKREKIFSVVLTVLLLGFVGMVFYINFSINPEYYDGDIYNDINYAKEAWKAKSLFPKDWIFGNQTYVVATPVLAALFYGITGNGFTAMATHGRLFVYDWLSAAQSPCGNKSAGNTGFFHYGKLLCVLSYKCVYRLRLLCKNSPGKIYGKAYYPGNYRCCAQLRNGYAKLETNGSYGIAARCL